MVAKKKTPARKKQTTQKTSFFEFQPSVQTVYWLILCLLVLAVGIWVMQLTIQTQAIYDQVQYLNMTSSEIPQ